MRLDPRLRRRGFLRLALAGALAPLGARAAAEEPPPGALDAQRATRNTWRGPTGIGSWLAPRPLPFKPYPDAPRTSLPDARGVASRPLAETLRGFAPARAFRPEPIALDTLAGLLRLTNGVTGQVIGSDPVEYRRAAPSAGALYAGEVYVAAGRVSGLAPGVYSYAVAEHALLRIGEGPALAALARAIERPGVFENAACAVLLTNVFARYAWRYGARGYRYALVDSGSIGENLRLAAAAAGLGVASPFRFHDDALNALLGVDGREEAVCALHAVGHAAQERGGEPARALVEKRHADVSLETVERYHEASKLVPGEDGPPPAAPPPAPPAPAQDAVPLPREAPEPARSVEECIRLRRSALGFRDEAIALDALGFVLAMARGPAMPAGVELRVVAHRVAGLEPGLYGYHPAAHALEPLRRGSLARRMIRACLFQEMAGTAAAGFVGVGDVAAAAARSGERSYRDLLLEAGATAERVYLAAEALGLAARNLAAFFDDSFNELVGLDGRERATLHLTTLGREC
jgi:SagB-type dehydrogenase family enzyme